MNRWSFRHYAVLILLLNITFLSWCEDRYKIIYFDIAKVAIGAYLGQLVPQGIKND